MCFWIECVFNDHKTKINKKFNFDIIMMTFLITVDIYIIYEPTNHYFWYKLLKKSRTNTFVGLIIYLDKKKIHSQLKCVTDILN